MRGQVGKTTQGAGIDDKGHLSEVSPDDPADDVMMAAERRTQIVQLVRIKGRVKVNELKNRFRTWQLPSATT